MGLYAEDDGCRRRNDEPGKEINEKLIPAIFGRDSAVCKLDRDLFALPGRHSGMGIDNPGKSAAHHLRASQILSNQHVHLILNSQRELKLDEEKQKALKEQLKQEKEVALKKEYNRIYHATSKPLAKAMELATEKGAVTPLPLGGAASRFLAGCCRRTRSGEHHRPLPSCTAPPHDLPTNRRRRSTSPGGC